MVRGLGDAQVRATRVSLGRDTLTEPQRRIQPPLPLLLFLRVRDDVAVRPDARLEDMASGGDVHVSSIRMGVPGARHYILELGVSIRGCPSFTRGYRRRRAAIRDVDGEDEMGF